MWDIEHVWIGTTLKGAEEFSEYFKLDYAVPLDEPEYKVCGFCKAIGVKWYDEDFIGVVLKSSVCPIEQMIKEVLDNPISIQRALQYCKEHHIDSANAAFWYCEEKQGELTFNKEAIFNDCFYIGQYDF